MLKVCLKSYIHSARAVACSHWDKLLFFLEQMETGQSEQERADNRNQWPIKWVAVCWVCEMPHGSEHFNFLFKPKLNKLFNWELHCSTEWTVNSADSSFTTCCRVHTFLWTWNCWGWSLLFCMPLVISHLYKITTLLSTILVMFLVPRTVSKHLFTQVVPELCGSG